MREIASFSQESGKIAQILIEEKEAEQSEVSSFTFANSNHYLGLILLSIFIFLFLAFLLFKRKSQEVRLSIFVSLFLGFLLAIYTSVQIATQSLVGSQKEEEFNERKRGLIVEEEEVSDRKPDNKENEREKDSDLEEEVKSLQVGINEIEDPIRAMNNRDISAESRGNNSDRLEDREQENLANNDVNISRPTTSQTSNLESVSEQRTINEIAPNQSQIGHTNRTSLRRTTSSRDRNLSSNTQTSLFRPILKLGDRGFDVILLQRILKALGYYTLDIDGDYGISTQLAVQNFQQQNNLLADGIVGFSTCNILKVKSTTVDIDCHHSHR